MAMCVSAQQAITVLFVKQILMIVQVSLVATARPALTRLLASFVLVSQDTLVSCVKQISTNVVPTLA